MRIVFSAIGTSDPVREYHDGGWIHCLRSVHPELTYIYLSKVMLEHEKTDHRFSRTLELFNRDMAGKELPAVKLMTLERPKLDNPHVYGNLYEDIKSELTKIHKQYPQAEIYINCSSGTPAMKNCLADMRFLLPFGEEIKLLQVDDPVRGERKIDERNRDDYDIETNWDLNEDRKTGSPCRAHDLAPDQHDMMIRALYAKILVKEHNYHAAKLLIEADLRLLQDGMRVLNALEGADLRSMMILDEAAEKLAKAGIKNDQLEEVRKSDLRKCAEMLLTMQNDVEARHFADMLRKMTPLLYCLCQEIIYQHCRWNTEKYMFKDGPNKGRINDSLLKTEQPEFYHTLTKTDGYLDTKAMLPYIKSKIKDKEAVDLIQKLRNVEMDVRNVPAHDIVGIKDSWIRQNTRDGLCARDILDLFKKLFLHFMPVYGDTFWSSYEKMDEEICRLLDGINYSALKRDVR